MNVVLPVWTKCFILEIEGDANTNTFEMFFIDNDPQVVFDDEKSYFGMP